MNRFLRRCALAFTLFSVAAAGAHAAVSPYPPIALGNVQVGTQLTSDVVVPLSMTIAGIPAAFDAQVVFVSANALEDAALALVGLASPVTVAQLKAQHPTWGVTIPVPTSALDNPSGMYSLLALGCDATQCTYRATYAPTAPGVHTAQLAVSVASITFTEAGLLGILANAFSSFLLGLVNASLVFDFTGTGVAVQLSGPALAVPAGDPAMLAWLAALVAALGVGAIGLRRRR